MLECQSMNFDFKVRFSKQNFPTFLMMGFIFVSACSFEDFNSKIQSEKNETTESQMDQLEQSSKNEISTFNHSLDEISEKFKDHMHLENENNFLKIKSMVSETIANQSKETNIKYQFLCDENERWIYRCNLITGQIECFSMSSNKLRLLSSIK